MDTYTSLMASTYWSWTEEISSKVHHKRVTTVTFPQ